MERGLNQQEKDLFSDKVVECSRCGHSFKITKKVLAKIKAVERYGGEQYEIDCPGCNETLVLA